MFDLNNFVIDRVVRGIAVSQGDNAKLGISAGDVLFSINQIQNASLNCTSESTDAVDALNVPIATFYRAKTAEFSAENALFDMSLLATQAGTTKKVASADAKIEAPCFQTIDITAASKNAKNETSAVTLAPKNNPSAPINLTSPSPIASFPATKPPSKVIVKNIPPPVRIPNNIFFKICFL